MPLAPLLKCIALRKENRSESWLWELWDPEGPAAPFPGDDPKAGDKSSLSLGPPGPWFVPMFDGDEEEVFEWLLGDDPFLLTAGETDEEDMMKAGETGRRPNGEA